MSLYSRQELLGSLGKVGQRALLESHVLIIGLGGIGCAVAQQLTAMGVGTLTLVDGDVVSESNLSRQILYTAADIGEKKVRAAIRSLEQLRPTCHLIGYDEFITASACEELFSRASVVVDATDKFESKFLINAACVKYGKPLVWGNAQNWEGQIAVFYAKTGPCYQCLVPTIPRFMGKVGVTCQEVGVLGAVPNVLGGMQAIETVKVIGDLHKLEIVPQPNYGQLSSFSFRDFSTHQTKVTKNFSCPICSVDARAIVLPKVGVTLCSVGDFISSCTVSELKNMTSWMLFDVRETEERDVLPVPGSIHVPFSQILLDPKSVAEAIVAAGTSVPTLAFFCKSGQRSRKALSLLNIYVKGSKKLFSLVESDDVVAKATHFVL